MTITYSDNLGMVKVKLADYDSIAFFDGFVFCTTATDECLKLKVENVLLIEKD